MTDQEKLKIGIIQAIAALTAMGLTFEQAKAKFLEDLQKSLPNEAPTEREEK